MVNVSSRTHRSLNLRFFDETVDLNVEDEDRREEVEVEACTCVFVVDEDDEGSKNDEEDGEEAEEERMKNGLSTHNLALAPLLSTLPYLLCLL